jgi:hypothetical protein
VCALTRFAVELATEEIVDLPQLANFAIDLREYPCDINVRMICRAGPASQLTSRG